MSERQLHDRALEPVSRRLINHLTVPYIYQGVAWPDESGMIVDVLAIDRAGRGDPHIVEIKTDLQALTELIEKLHKIPSAYRWIACSMPGSGINDELTFRSWNTLYPSSGPGRIGIIHIVTMVDGDLGANIVVKAERFPGTYHKLVDGFVNVHEPIYRV